MANIRWAATVAALQAEAGMANGEAAILAGYFSVGDGGGSSVWFSTTIVSHRKITGATNATPIVITTQAPHGLSTGQRVMIAGVGGNTAANRTSLITVTGLKTFSLDGSRGNGEYTSGGAVGDGGYTFPSASATTGIWTRANESELTIRWFGAKGDGGTDDTHAIQAALDHVRTNGGTLRFPAGRYRITSTLNGGSSQGVSYLGAGASRRSTLAGEDGSTPQHPTALLWRGSDGGTLFKHTGADCTFDGLSFWGGLDSDPGTDPPRAGIGLLLAPSGPIGTGKNHYGRVALTHCDVGFQAGTATSDSNCDNLNFAQVCFRHCDRGFVVKHDQGIKYNFQTAWFADIATACIDFERGGGLNVDSLFGVRTPVLLKIQGGGPAFAHYRMGGVQLDGGQDARVVWLLHEPSTANLDMANVVFDGGMGGTGPSQAQGGTEIAAFQIAGRCVLRVRNIMNGMTNTWGDIGSVAPSPLLKITGTSGRTASAIFESCGLDDTNVAAGNWLQLAGSGTTRHRSVRDCHNARIMTRIPDVEAIS